MACCGEREKGPVSDEQKWDYITLSDFRSNSCIAPLSYTWLWILVFVSVAVYAADTFTAINLLAHNKWSSSVQPDQTIPFAVSKWIFAICIMISWALCGLAWLRAIRVIRGGGVADSYLDPLAATLQSTRVGRNGRGWRRFLVFAELTKSKKGTDYIALFVYFQFKGALRVMIAEGPRQAVNALTLWAFMRDNLLPEGQHSGDGHTSPIEQFLLNVQDLAGQDHQQAVVLCTMLFTLTIWVITALCLTIATILYIIFLWHYIPNSDGTLARYCRRKIDSRLERIVTKKYKKKLEKDEAKRRKDEKKAIKKGEHVAPIQKQPTLPFLPGTFNGMDSASSLSRTSTQAMLPQHPSQSNYPNISNASRPIVQRQPTLPFISEDRGRLPLSRSVTQSSSYTQSSGYSTRSYGSNAPLLSGAQNMGFGEPGCAWSVPPLGSFDSTTGRPGNHAMSSRLPRSYAPVNRPPYSQDSGRYHEYPSQDGEYSSDCPDPRPLQLRPCVLNRRSPVSSDVTPPSRQDNNSCRPLQRQTTNDSSMGHLTSRDYPLRPGSNQSFSPFDQGGNPLPHGPSYELSPVDRSLPQQVHFGQNLPATLAQINSTTEEYDPFRAASPAPAPYLQDPLRRHASNTSSMGSLTGVWFQSESNSNSTHGARGSGYIAYNPQAAEALRSASVSPLYSSTGTTPTPSIANLAHLAAQRRGVGVGTGMYGARGRLPPERSQTTPLPDAANERSNYAPAVNLRAQPLAR